MHPDKCGEGMPARRDRVGENKYLPRLHLPECSTMGWKKKNISLLGNNLKRSPKPPQKDKLVRLGCSGERSWPWSRRKGSTDSASPIGRQNGTLSRELGVLFCLNMSLAELEAACEQLSNGNAAER